MADLAAGTADPVSLGQRHSAGTGENISTFLLRLIGLDGKRVRKNAQNELQNLSFRNLAEPGGPGFWVFTRHEDVGILNRDWQTNSSENSRGGVVMLQQPTPEEQVRLDEIGDAIGGLAGDLSHAEVEATARERRLAKLAYRFETVVSVGREIAGSLSVRYVSASVTTAAADLLSASTVLWLRRESKAGSWRSWARCSKTWS